MKSHALFLILLISSLTLVAQDTRTSLNISESDTLALQNSGVPYSAAVSDGWIIKTNLKSDDGSPHKPSSDGGYGDILYKLDFDGRLIDSFFIGHVLPHYGGYDGLEVKNDTILYASDYYQPGSQPGTAPCASLVQMDKDFNVLQAATFPDTQFTESLSLFTFAKTTDGDNTGYRFTIDTKANTSSFYTVYAEKYSLDGRYAYNEITTGIFKTYNDMIMSEDRLLMTSHAAFAVLDTNLNVIADQIRWIDHDEYPFSDSGWVGGYPSRGIIINGTFYFFLTGYCMDTETNCLTGQKWKDTVRFAQERIFSELPEYSEQGGGIRGDKLATPQGGTPFVYDGDTTVYTVTLQRSNSELPLRYELAAVDTQFHMLWRKSIEIPYKWAHTASIAFSADSTRLLLTATRNANGAQRDRYPILAYVIDLDSVSVVSAGPLASFEREHFLSPSPASAVVRVTAVPGADAIATVELYSLSDGRRTSHVVGAGGELDVSAFPSGAYAAYGYGVDGAPLCRQRIVVVH